MRKNFTITFLFLFLSLAFVTATSASTIDHSDTLIFDISSAIISGNQIDIPVLIHSNDTVYALDFALTYDHSQLTFDSIINTTAYIQSFYYYNSTDSTLRFTSNSLHPYAIDSPLVFVRFTMLNGTIAGTNINNGLALLNGDTCSSMIMDPTLGVDDISDFDDIIMYPNPAADVLYVNSKCKRIDIIDGYGKIVYSGKQSGYSINTTFLPNGFYVCRFYQDGQASEKSLVISH